MATQQSEHDRKIAELKANIEFLQGRVEQTIADAITEVHPKTVVNRTVHDAKAFAENQFEQAKVQVKDEYGWRIDRIALAAGAVVGMVTFLLVVRSLTKKSKGA